MNTAHRFTCFMPASLRDPTRRLFRAREQAVFADWNAVSHQRPAQHGIPADRFAREIVRFLM